MDFSALQTRVKERLDEPSSPVYWTAAEIKEAINKAQRRFCLYTLCVERTASFAVTSDAFYSISSSITDFIKPLKVYNAQGTRVFPYTLYQLQMENPAWRADAGSPTKYAQDGFDQLAITKQPASSQNLTITYAASPAVLTNNSDVPEIPEEHHPCLIEFAIYWLRLKEGGQELQKTLPMLGSFLDSASKYGEFTRARSKAQMYDHQPFDLSSFDRSRLLKMTLSGPRGVRK